MAFNEAAGSRVNSTITKATGAPTEFSFGQHGVRNETAVTEKPRPIPTFSFPSTSPTGVKRKTSIPYSVSKSPSSPPSLRRALSSNIPEKSPTIYPSPNNLNRPAISSLSSPVHSSSTRSPTAASPSRITQPRALPALPATGRTSRARKNSSADPSPGPTVRTIDPSLVKVNPLAAPRTAKPRPPANVKPSAPVVSCVSSMGDRFESRSHLSNGKELRLEQEVKPNSRSEQSARPTASEVSTNLGLLPGDVNVLKSLWEDSAIEDDAFDPGGSESPVDRSAVKSGYGSVFGFNLAPKSRTSVAITEDSSLDRSSIASVLSSSSTKTVSNSRAVSPFPSVQPVSRAVPHLAPTVPGPSVFPPKTGFTTKLPILESRSLVQPAASTSELRPTKSTGASGSTSRVSLPTSPPLRLKSAPISASNAMPTPQAAPSDVPLPKGLCLTSTPFIGTYPRIGTSTQLASSPDIKARLPGPVVIPPHPSKYEMSRPHTFGTELAPSSKAASASVFVNPQIPEWETNTLASAPLDQNSSHPPPRPRYTSNNSSISANHSPSSPFGLSAAPGGHHYSPQNSPPAHPPTVNLKHLLSKPAPTGNSSASESESVPASKNSRPVRRIERIEEKNEKQRIEAVTRERANESDGEVPSIQRTLAGGSRERDRARKSEWEAERVLLKERSSLNTGPITPRDPPADTSQPKDSVGLGSRLVRSTSWSRSREREGTEKAEKKPRNVLKRRPSTANISNTSPEVADLREFPYSSFAPAYTGSILPVTPRRLTTSGNLKPPTPGHSSSRGSSPARDERRRSLIPQSAMLKLGGVGSDDAVPISSGTTPAKEIMLAYKQQQEREKNREKERSERIREKQRERELWQREEEDRQRRALKDTQALPTVSYNNDRALSASEAISQGSSSKSIPSPVKLRPERSFSAPNTSTYPHSPTRTANVDLPLSPQSVNSPSRTPKSLRDPVPPADEELAQPYYTVFGDSRPVVPVQGVTTEESFLPDFSWSTSNLEEGLLSSIGATLGLDQQPDSPHVWERSASVTAGKLSSKSSTFGLGKTLSRKVSGRLGPSKKEPGASSAPAMILQERGRQSLQERKDTATSSRDKRCLRLSIDDYGPSKSAPTSTSPIPVIHRSREGELRGSMTPVMKHSLPLSPQVRPTSAAGLPSGSKSKIWNLMKRISTGGLRDSYRGYDGSASSSLASPLSLPPVPALPKDLSVYAKGTRTKDDTDLAYGHRTRNVTSTPAPISTGKNSSSTTSSRIPVTRFHGPSETSTSTSTRAGTATRSSSPISSSDIGSSKFFNRSQSQRSSSSSYGEQIPPVPIPPAKVTMLQQHILPPSELYKLHLSLERNKEGPSPSKTSHARSSLSINTTPSLSNSRSHPNLKLQVQRPKTASSAEEWMIVPTPRDERPGFSLPVPRRRGEGNLQRPPPVFSNKTRSPSPIIPMFSNEAVINTWSSGMSRKTKTSGSVTPPSNSDPFNSSPRVSSPPAIPSKSPRRTASASASLSPTKLPSLPPLPSTASSDGGYTKSDHESETTSRRASRKSMGSGISSDTQTSNRVRRRATSSSGKSTVRDLSSTVPSRPPRSEPPRSSRIPGILSDKQKADNLKWDNLLERSNKAGGTLHLNGGMGRLPSDRLAYDIEDDY